MAKREPLWMTLLIFAATILVILASFAVASIVGSTLGTAVGIAAMCSFLFLAYLAPAISRTLRQEWRNGKNRGLPMSERLFDMFELMLAPIAVIVSKGISVTIGAIAIVAGVLIIGFLVAGIASLPVSAAIIIGALLIASSNGRR